MGNSLKYRILRKNSFYLTLFILCYKNVIDINVNNELIFVKILIDNSYDTKMENLVNDEWLSFDIFTFIGIMKRANESK